MRVIRPQNMWSYYKAVSGSVLNATYLPDWAADGRFSRPFRGAGTGGSFTISGAAGMVDMLVLGNSNIMGGATVSVSGSVTENFTIAAARPNEIPRNPFIWLDTPVSVSSLTVTVAGNADPFVVGEFFAGLSEPFDFLEQDNEFGFEIYYIETEDVDVSSVIPTDLGAEARELSGGAWLTLQQRTFMEDWVSGSMGNTRPTILIPNESDDDAWACKVSAKITYKQKRGDPDRLYYGNMTLTEWKRHRW